MCDGCAIFMVYIVSGIESIEALKAPQHFSGLKHILNELNRFHPPVSVHSVVACRKLEISHKNSLLADNIK